MIQSMTGYGKATAELPDKKINVEIKSLNSKAMDLSARIAPLYREKEMEIRNEISRKLERGKVDFSLWIEKKESAESATPINQTLVEGYYKQICAISENLGIPVPDATDWFATLLRMPDVMTKNDTQELSEEEWAVVYSAVEKAVGALVDFRKQEGAALEKKFREKIENIHRLLESVTPYEKERVEDAVLMFCKHCLRYSMGLCPIHQRVRSPYKEPYYLVSNDGKRFRLEFDCKNCQMKVKAAQ